MNFEIRWFEMQDIIASLEAKREEAREGGGKRRI